MDVVLAFKGGSPSRWGHYAYANLVHEIKQLDRDIRNRHNIREEVLNLAILGAKKKVGDEGRLVDVDGSLVTPQGIVVGTSGDNFEEGLLGIPDLDAKICQASSQLIRNDMDYSILLRNNELFIAKEEKSNSPVLLKKPGSLKPELVLLAPHESVMTLVAFDRLMEWHPDLLLKTYSHTEMTHILRELTPLIAITAFAADDAKVCRDLLQNTKIFNRLVFSWAVDTRFSKNQALCNILADYQNVQRVLRVMKQVCPDLFVKDLPSSIEATQPVTPVAVVEDEVLPQVVQPDVVDIAPELESNRGEVEHVEAVDEESHIPLNQRKKHQRGTVDTRWDEVDPNKIADEVLSLFFTVQYYDGVPPELPDVRRVGLGTPRAVGGSTSLSNVARSSSIRPRNEVGGTVAVMRKIDFDYTVNRVRHAARWIRKIEGRPTGHKLPHRTQLEMKNWHHVAGYVLQARAVDVTFPLRQDQDGNTLVLTAFPSPWMEILPNIDAAADFATPKDPLFLQGEVLQDEDYEPAK